MLRRSTSGAACLSMSSNCISTNALKFAVNDFKNEKSKRNLAFYRNVLENRRVGAASTFTTFPYRVGQKFDSWDQQSVRFNEEYYASLSRTNCKNGMKNCHQELILVQKS